MVFKYLSLNIWEGGLLLNKLIDYIKKENADIIVLQEVFNSKNKNHKSNYRSLDLLRKALDYPYFDFASAFLEIIEKDKIECGNAVFSRFPIKAGKKIFYDTPYGVRPELTPKYFLITPRVIQNLKIKVKQVELDIFNIHGIWGFDGKDNPRRLKMSKAIIKLIKNKKRVILSGDFNVRPDTKTIANIENHLTNVFKGRLETTFNLKRKTKKGGYKDSVVDMVFVSSDIKVIASYCPQVDVSDHMPLVCKFKT